MLLAAFATASNGVVVWLTAELMNGKAWREPAKPSGQDGPHQGGAGASLYA